MKGSGWCSEASSSSGRDMNVKPAWLEKLMAETFFATCGVHMNHKKNDKNIFCLHCCLSICPHCTFSSHTSHPLLQVRRYVYHDVVRLSDLEKLIDCSNIQGYTINGAKVIFLKERAQRQSRSCKGTGNACLTCHRILQDPFHFCSLSCKVDHMVCEGEGLSNIIESDFTYLQFEGLRVDCYTQFVPTSCSNSEATSNIAIANNNNNDTNAFFLSLGSRRKGAPHRAPLS